MSQRVTNVILAGLGGQGVIKASDILADAAVRAGYGVKKAEVHGMSQRGGSVTSDVRFGPRVLSPMIPRGEADFLVVLAPSEVEVTRPLLRPGGVLLAPDFVPEAIFLEAVRAALAERLHAANQQAFQLGRALAVAAGAAAAAAGR